MLSNYVFNKYEKIIICLLISIRNVCYFKRCDNFSIDNNINREYHFIDGCCCVSFPLKYSIEIFQHYYCFNLLFTFVVIIFLGNIVQTCAIQPKSIISTAKNVSFQMTSIHMLYIYFRHEINSFSRTEY